ncbi:MAG: hypothetical protein ACK5QS_07775 [Pseudanabaenaceae cyanobacterium]
MFYYEPPPPIYLVQISAYEKCRQQEIENELRSESISPYGENYGRRALDIVGDYFTDICYREAREEIRKKEEIEQRKALQARSRELKKTNPVAFQMGEYYAEKYCKLIAGNPKITTWGQINYLAGEDSKMIQIENNRQSMMYHAESNIQARQDLESFNLGAYTKQLHYQNCTERLNSLAR